MVLLFVDQLLLLYQDYSAKFVALWNPNYLNFALIYITDNEATQNTDGKLESISYIFHAFQSVTTSPESNLIGILHDACGQIKLACAVEIKKMNRKKRDDDALQHGNLVSFIRRFFFGCSKSIHLKCRRC